MAHRSIKDKNDSILWAKSILLNPDSYVILDTETTGLESNDVIVQIGIIDLKGSILLNSLIKPTKRKSIPSSATNIHGITMNMLENAPYFKDIIPEVEKVTADKIVLIYNEEYDTRIINQTCDQDGCKPMRFKHDCIMRQYSKFVGDWNDYFGNYRFQRLPSGDHSAIGDCQAALLILRKLSFEKL
jgi:DNA polymerase-3 subunit epsilon